MHAFTAHRLRFIAQAQEIIELNEHQGSAIRGSLFHALRNRFCGNKEAPECAACPLVATCPVAFLVSTLKPESGRGRDVPRPFTVQPPLPGAGGHRVETDDGRLFFRYEPGEPLEFGLTLYARALQLFPYLVLAVHEFEQGGVGRRIEQTKGRWQRGRLSIREVWAENPLTGERQPVLRAGDRLVQVPDIPITHQQVTDYVLHLTPHTSSLTLHFLTPTRIIERGHLLKPEAFHLRPFFQRLMERLEALSRDFSDTPLLFDDPQGLIEAAGRVRVVENRLFWEELRSYSTRRRAESPTSGLLGTVTLEADNWTPFLPWLVWGQFTHVGKDAVKGGGLYILRAGAESQEDSHRTADRDLCPTVRQGGGQPGGSNNQVPSPALRGGIEQQKKGMVQFSGSRRANCQFALLFRRANIRPWYTAVETACGGLHGRRRPYGQGMPCPYSSP